MEKLGYQEEEREEGLLKTLMVTVTGLVFSLIDSVKGKNKD